MSGNTGGPGTAAGGCGVPAERWRDRHSYRSSVFLLVLLVLAGCQKPAPAPQSAAQVENTAPLPPVLPKTYAEQTDDRLVLIKDRLQLLKDQAAPLRGASMRMANTRIKTIETKIHAADKEVGHLRRQAITPAQQQAISRQLAQIEYDIDQASQEIATHQERR